ncbi:NTP transferase domain-containing protein [Lachnospiraceae bacterium LCP25S3_G4]
MKKYKVDNAVIMSAGMSSRFAPLSYECPKALLVVKGEVLIERQIRQLQEAGIKEIVIVVGYMKEKFEYLKEKYQVILVENPAYNMRNNHSSLFVAKEYLKNTYICSGDNYFVENVFCTYEEVPYYSTVYEDGLTDEWCVTTNTENRIIEVEIGGKNAWVMLGHAFFTNDFSQQIIPFLEKAYKSQKMCDFYWEDIFILHLNEFKMYKKEFAHDKVLEFDSLDDLKNFDPRYISKSGSKIMESICETLQCQEKEIMNIRPLKHEEETVGISFLCQDYNYKYYYKEKELKREKK